MYNLRSQNKKVTNYPIFIVLFKLHETNVAYFYLGRRMFLLLKVICLFCNKRNLQYCLNSWDFRRRTPDSGNHHNLRSQPEKICARHVSLWGHCGFDTTSTVYSYSEKLWWQTPLLRRKKIWSNFHSPCRVGPHSTHIYLPQMVLKNIFKPFLNLL